MGGDDFLAPSMGLQVPTAIMRRIGIRHGGTGFSFCGKMLVSKLVNLRVTDIPPGLHPAKMR